MCDLSTSSHSHSRDAVQFDAISKEFTNLATIASPGHYYTFMHNTFQQQQLQQRNHQDAWSRYARWSSSGKLMRNLKDTMASSPLTPWLNHWLLILLPDEEFMPEFKTDFDDPQVASREALSLVEWVRSSLTALLPWPRHPQPQAQDLEPQLSFNSTNLVNILMSALGAIKGEVLRKSNITITSAVISKPKWPFNELDQLLEEACSNANFEAFTLIERSQSAIRLAKRSWKFEPVGFGTEHLPV